MGSFTVVGDLLRAVTGFLKEEDMGEDVDVAVFTQDDLNMGWLDDEELAQHLDDYDEKHATILIRLHSAGRVTESRALRTRVVHTTDAVNYLYAGDMVFEGPLTVDRITASVDVWWGDTVEVGLGLSPTIDFPIYIPVGNTLTLSWTEDRPVVRLES